MLLCITGTGLTWWNYSRQVFSSARGVAALEGSDCRVLVHDFPPRAYEMIQPGHQARVTIGRDPQIQLMKGSVISVDRQHPGIVIRVAGEGTAPQLTNGESCAVTIDTTVPPIALP
jgi:hypothetical protein